MTATQPDTEAVELLQVRGATKTFGGIRAVSNVDLAVRKGEIAGLIGPNGSGKTTLFNIISGVYQADAGRVVLQGRDITGSGPARVAGLGIARTFQHVRPFMHLSVTQNVAVARAYGHVPARNRHDAEEEAQELVDFVGLGSRKEALAASLTLVDRKRLELARALAIRPVLLLLDEFLAGLNPSEVVSELDLIRRVRDQGVTIVMVEHLVQALFSIVDRVAVMNAGEKIADGTPAAVATNQAVIDAYLGVGHHA